MSTAVMPDPNNPAGPRVIFSSTCEQYEIDSAVEKVAPAWFVNWDEPMRDLRDGRMWLPLRRRSRAGRPPRHGMAAGQISVRADDRRTKRVDGRSRSARECTSLNGFEVCNSAVTPEEALMNDTNEPGQAAKVGRALERPARLRRRLPARGAARTAVSESVVASQTRKTASGAASTRRRRATPEGRGGGARGRASSRSSAPRLRATKRRSGKRFAGIAADVFARKVKDGKIVSPAGRETWRSACSRSTFVLMFGPIYVDRLTTDDIERPQGRAARQARRQPRRGSVLSRSRSTRS